jgi:diguanylate cyclase (GGDEF)-like protein/PAS domain S-box-containing protein
LENTAQPLNLKSARDLTETLFDAMNDGVLVIDHQGVIIDCNPAFHHRLGYRKQEIVGRTIRDLDPPEFAERIPERLDAVNRRGHATFETAHRRADGGILPVEITCHLVAIQGEPAYFGIVRDISERKGFEEALKEGLEVYRAAINTPAVGFWAVDMTGRIHDVNDAYIRQSGYCREQLVEMHIADLEAEQDEEEIRERIRQITQDGFARFRTRHRRKDGSEWPLEAIVSYSSILGGRFFAFFEDLSAQIEQERKLELAARVFDTMDQAVVVTDGDNRIVSINPATTKITGYRLDEVQGRDPKIFSSGRHDREFYREMWQTLQATGHWEGEIWDRRKDGKVYPKWLTLNAIRDSKGRVDQYVSVFSDITERKKTEEIIWKQANFDPLTGLANRILFHTQLERELECRQRNAGMLGVVYMDLDGFKDVNDTLGHASGDRLLIAVAARLKKVARDDDLLARLGGDEFVVLVKDFAHPEQIGSLAERILGSLKEPVWILGKEVRIGASIGIALYPEDGETSEELIKHADLAMYRAKEEGKNDFRFFRQEMNLKAQQRLALIHDLHRAVDEEVFELYYQPKIRLADGKIIGMEALLRWPVDGGQMISPAQFIPCAEETGLIVPMGNWVTDEAIRQTSDWNRRFGSCLKVAVNLSARQFHVDDLAAKVMRMLRIHDLPAKCLELEITESILMGGVEEAIAVMNSIRDQGISIAIDDFGTGYSSLAYLKRFPLSTLKIDQSFVRELSEDSVDAAIVNSIITLARSLAMEVCAEGVESAEQLAFLEERQCDCAQGYHFARPLPAQAFEEYLLERDGQLLRG